MLVVFASMAVPRHPPPLLTWPYRTAPPCGGRRAGPPAHRPLPAGGDCCVPPPSLQSLTSGAATDRVSTAHSAPPTNLSSCAAHLTPTPCIQTKMARTSAVMLLLALALASTTSARVLLAGNGNGSSNGSGNTGSGNGELLSLTCYAIGSVVVAES